MKLLQVEQRKRFVADVLAAEKAMLRSGKGYLAKDIHDYLKAKVSGRKLKRPKARRLDIRMGKAKKWRIKGIEVEMSSGNVFADLGLSDADKLKAKSARMIEAHKAARRLKRGRRGAG